MTWKVDTTKQDKELRDFCAKHPEITDHHKALCVGTVRDGGLEAQEWELLVGDLRNHEWHMKWEKIPRNATLVYKGKVDRTDDEITKIGKLLFSEDQIASPMLTRSLQAMDWVERNPKYGPRSRCWTFVEDVWNAISDV